MAGGQRRLTAPMGGAISGDVDPDEDAQDRRDAGALLDALENTVAPLFYSRDPDGVPRAWVKMIKASLRTVGLRFSARRMLEEYITRMYLA